MFFRQERVGWRGRRFLCLKFRTMTHNPNACFVQAQKDDPRITPIGRFLRKTNLDELPQFINVLLGHMAVAVSRPHVYELDLMHSDSVPGTSSAPSCAPVSPVWPRFPGAAERRATSAICSAGKI